MNEALKPENLIIPEQQREQSASEILADLDLKLEDLRGKNVLDIGAGNAKIAKAANKQGAKVFSLEHDLDFVRKEFSDFSEKDANYVQAKADKMPFKDESFDLLISHGGPPNISDNKNEIEAVVNEGHRVLRQGGEWRIGHGYLSAGAFSDLNLPEDLLTEERMSKIREASFNFLKSIWPGQVEEIQKGKNLDEMYYRLIKEKI